MRCLGAHADLGPRPALLSAGLLPGCAEGPATGPDRAEAQHAAELHPLTGLPSTGPRAAQVCGLGHSLGWETSGNAAGLASSVVFLQHRVPLSCFSWVSSH